MTNLYFVTSNDFKLQEAKNILGFEIEKIDLDIDEIQSLEVEEVIKKKAEEAYAQVKKPVMVEDTGLYIKAWKGFPGALIKWVLKTLDNEGLCKSLVEDDRSATAKTSVCIYNGQEFEVFSGEIEGEITEKPRGESGFGWDPIFRPKGYDQTFAEMGQEEKDKMSMRKIALTKLKKFIDSHPGHFNL